MQLEERIAGNVAIVKVTGDITLNKGGDVLLKDKVQSLLQQDYKNLLVDLGGVSHVDSAGLGELVQAYVTTKNKGGTLKLVNVTKRLNDLLVLTKLVTVFETHDTEAAALASFGSASA
jgi:anti-sigma B factor antagonist